MADSLKRPTLLFGKVVSGLGEGQGYISMDGYRSQIRKLLGFDPFPGTLNLRLESPFALPEDEAIVISGFISASRSYGSCKCYPCKIGGRKCAIIRPDRSAYPPSLIEIIAPVHLRESMNLQDGDEVEVGLER
jgi:riboflavin kinase